MESESDGKKQQERESQQPPLMNGAHGKLEIEILEQSLH